MQYGILFALLGMVQLCLATQTAYAGVLWGWSGFSFLAVASAYLGIGPGLFGKKPDGSLPL
jgi:predicted cobalt transporter CbtA